MSEQENVELIQKALELFGRGDVQAILDRCTKDCEFYCPGPSTIPYSGKRHGLSEIQTYFEALIGTQNNPNLSIEQLVAQDDTVVAIGRYAAQVKATGKSFDSPVVLTFHFEDGKIKRHMVVGDTAAAAESYRSTAAAAR